MTSSFDLIVICKRHTRNAGVIAQYQSTRMDTAETTQLSRLRGISEAQDPPCIVKSQFLATGVQRSHKRNTLVIVGTLKSVAINQRE